MERQQQTNYRADQESCSEKVDFEDLLFDCHIEVLPLRRLKEEAHSENGDGAEGPVTLVGNGHLVFTGGAHKFIQKQYLHDALSVKAPPSKGPITEEIPNMDDMIAIYIGLLIKGTEKPTMVIPDRRVRR